MTATAAKPIPPRPGLGASRRRLGEVLRVDHAGELAAVHIYRGQRAVFGQAAGKAGLEADFARMEREEGEHLAAFDQLLTDNAVRPSLLAPFWRAAGFGLGAATALMGEKAAHACTEAVEEVIEKHYAGQIAELADREPELTARLAKFRDEELGHRDHAVQGGAREAPAYRLLSAVIRTGCRVAIKAAEKV